MTMRRIKTHWRWLVFAALLVLVPIGVWAGTATPIANGAGAAGTGPGLSFEDHVHPLGTTSSAVVEWDTTSSAAGQNHRAASGANAAGEYGFVAGTNAIVTDGTQVGAWCSDCDGTPTYVWTVSADGNVLLDATAPLMSTASSAAGINLGIASGANASGEYAVSVGTNAAAGALLDLLAIGSDIDGTPVYALTVENIAADGTGANIATDASAAGINLTLASGANASGEYGVVVGTNAAAGALNELFGIASDVDGTPVYALSVENIAADGSGASIYNTASNAGINLTLASGADAAGDYGVTVGSNAAVSDTTQLFSVASDVDGTPSHVLVVHANGAQTGTLQGRGQFSICGDGTTINNNTVYYGPDTGITSSATIAMETCNSTAAGSTTEATADAAAFGGQAFQVTGMICRNAQDANATISYTLRTAEGATSPSVTCTIADNSRDCVADIQTTTAVASGATVAIAAASTSDVGTSQFKCTVFIAY